MIYQPPLLNFPLIITFAIFSSLLFSGCEQGKSNASLQVAKSQSTTASSPKPTHTDYLRLPIAGDLSTLDPGLSWEVIHFELVEQLFIGLTDFESQTYQVIPELATEWQVDDSGSRYTFKLRQDVKWTDGQPVTAHDVVWAIRRNLTPELDAPQAYTLYAIKNAEAIHKNGAKDLELGVRALDDYTVEFTLEYPAAYFPALTSLWTYHPLPKKVIEQQGENWTKPEHIQTSGPYRLQEWRKGQQLILVKNVDFYEASQVSIPEIHYHIVPESSLALAMYENNELDLIGGETYLRLPQLEIPRIQTDSVLRKDRRIAPGFCTEWYGFNTRLPPVDNVLVRKAIAAAVDKQIILDVVIGGGHTLANTFTRPPIFGSIGPTEGMGTLFNPYQAKQWLAEAGYPKGQGFPTLTLIHPVSETHEEIAKAIKTILKYHLDIEINVQAMEFDPYMDAVDEGKIHHLFRMGWCADYPDANNWLFEVFHPVKGINWVGWQNPEFAEAVELAQKHTDPVQRAKHYRQAEQILNQDQTVIIPIYFSNSQYLVKPWIKNWYNMALGGQHIRDWSIQPLVKE